MPYIPLSINSIDKFTEGLKKIQAYQNDMDRKINLALNRLADEGVAVCYSCNSFGSMILFTSSQASTGVPDIAEVVLIGRDVDKIISRWKYKGGVKEAEVSPLLMSEFGSGNFADNSQFENSPIQGVGQGTFPGQTHAFEASWHWVDADTNEYHTSSGLKPTYPMLTARNHMMLRVATVFREVFN